MSVWCLDGWTLFVLLHDLYCLNFMTRLPSWEADCIIAKCLLQSYSILWPLRDGLSFTGWRVNYCFLLYMLIFSVIIVLILPLLPGSYPPLYARWLNKILMAE